MTTQPFRRASIQRLEEIGFTTWPDFERVRYDGWELRCAAGVTRRANSVNPVAHSTLPLGDKIAYCEEWFADRGQPPVFRITELADPGLESELEQCGYERSSPTDTMVAPVPDEPMPIGLRIERHPSTEWFAAFCSWNGRDPALAEPLLALLESILGAAAYVSIDHGDRLAAVGLAVVCDEHVGIYNMNTDPAHRRTGLAMKVLAGLLSFGAARGATTAFLQVLQDNSAAQGLYHKGGFTTLYPYWYRERP